MVSIIRVGCWIFCSAPSWPIVNQRELKADEISSLVFARRSSKIGSHRRERFFSRSAGSWGYGEASLISPKPKLLGIAASLRNARWGAGNRALIEQLAAVADKDALLAFLRQE